MWQGVAGQDSNMIITCGIRNMQFSLTQIINWYGWGDTWTCVSGIIPSEIYIEASLSAHNIEIRWGIIPRRSYGLIIWKHWTGGDCTVRRFMIWTPHQSKSTRSNQGEWDDRDVLHMGKGKVRTIFGWESWDHANNLEDLGVDGGYGCSGSTRTGWDHEFDRSGSG